MAVPLRRQPRPAPVPGPRAHWGQHPRPPRQAGGTERDPASQGAQERRNRPLGRKEREVLPPRHFAPGWGKALPSPWGLIYFSTEPRVVF